MPKQLKIISEKCIGCKSCELACSLANDRKFDPASSRVAAITFLEGKYTLPYHFISTCRQCADAPCMASCPVEAISPSKDITKAVTIDSELCIGCGKCISSCPFGAVSLDTIRKKAFKCELCGGTPACVEACPTDAILFTRINPYYAQKHDLQMKGYDFMIRRNKERTNKKIKK